MNLYKNDPTPNLIIVETALDRGEMLTELDRLAEVCDPGTKVITIGRINDVLLYRELLRLGVSEYLVAPANVIQVIESIASIYTDPETGVGQVIAFVGAKGGCGSSPAKSSLPQRACGTARRSSSTVGKSAAPSNSGAASMRPSSAKRRPW